MTYVFQQLSIKFESELFCLFTLEVKAAPVRLEGISVRQSWRLKNDWSQMSSCDPIWFVITVASNRSKQRGTMKGWQRSDEQMKEFREEKRWMCVKCNEMGEWASGYFPILKWFHRRSCWLDLGKPQHSLTTAVTGQGLVCLFCLRVLKNYDVRWLKYPENDNELMWLKLRKAKIK